MPYLLVNNYQCFRGVPKQDQMVLDPENGSTVL